MKLIDTRPANKLVTFKNLPVGTVFEPPGVKMIFLKIETLKCDDDKNGRLTVVNNYKNAVRLDNRDDDCFGETWYFAPEGSVHPLDDVEIIIKG